MIHQNNYAIYIAQIDDTEYARCCYSVDESIADDGTIIKFNDNVFNTNITIIPQDSTSINNPNLIEDLAPGLYNIQRNFGGQIEETVIFKENN